MLEIGETVRLHCVGHSWHGKRVQVMEIVPAFEMSAEGDSLKRDLVFVSMPGDLLTPAEGPVGVSASKLQRV